MRKTVTIPDPLFDESMHFTAAESRPEAMWVAVKAYVRRVKLEQLRALRSNLKILGTEAPGEADVREQNA